MSDLRSTQASSRVVGVVYTDLVSYMLPGALLLGGLIVIFGSGATVLSLFTEAGAGLGVLLTLVTTGASWLCGMLLGAIRWMFSLIPGSSSPSFGRLLQSRVSPRTLRRLCLPAPVLAGIRKSIIGDLERLVGATDPNAVQTKIPLPGFSVAQLYNVDEVERERALLDCSWHILRGNLRESSLRLFPYLDRWRDIQTCRQNTTAALMLLSMAYLFRAGANGADGTLLSVGAAAVLFAISLLIYRYVLPGYEFSLMHPVILRYLVGALPIRKQTDQDRSPDAKAD